MRTFRSVTHLARAVDLDLPSNRLAVLATVVFTLGGTIATLLGDDIGVGQAVLRGLAYGVGAFLAWALGRELDPDRTRSARYALFAYVPVAFLGAPAPAALAALLLVVRVVLRPTGRPPTRIDLGVLIVLAGVSAAGATGFGPALALAYAVFMDTRLAPAADERDHAFVASAIVVVSVSVTIVTGSFLSDWPAPDWRLWVLVGLAALATTQLGTAAVRTRADLTPEPLRVDRLEHGRRLAVVTVAVAVAWAGAPAVTGLAPALCAVIGTAIGSLVTARGHRRAAITSSMAGR